MIRTKFFGNEAFQPCCKRGWDSCLTITAPMDDIFLFLGSDTLELLLISSTDTRMVCTGCHCYSHLKTEEKYYFFKHEARTLPLAVSQYPSPGYEMTRDPPPVVRWKGTTFWLHCAGVSFLLVFSPYFQGYYLPGKALIFLDPAS